MKKFLFWLTYFLAVGAAGWHTYSVFATTDPWPIALMATVAIEGALAYTLYLLSNSLGQQKNAALIGIVVFGAMSGMSQVIQRYTASGVDMPNWMRWVSLSLVPIATTGSVIILGIIHYFDRNKNGVPDFMERNKNKGQQHNQQPRQVEHVREEPRPVPVSEVRPALPPRNGAFPAHNGQAQRQRVGTDQKPLPRLVREDEVTSLDEDEYLEQ